MKEKKVIVEEKKEKSEGWGGARDNAGRKKGIKNMSTKQRILEFNILRQRIIRSKDALLNSQMTLAKGIQMLFKISITPHKDEFGNMTSIRSKPELVYNQWEIEDYLAGKYDESKEEYYFITTEKPDSKSIDSLLDRAFGKARQTIGVEGGEEGTPVKVDMQRLELGLKDWGDKEKK